MRREPGLLCDKHYDLCIIGGGIHGALVALEAAQRGLSVALIEQGDFGSATSHNSLKLIHGGLRYLQHLDFIRVRRSVRERRYWLTRAPHLTRPLGILMPLIGWGLRGTIGMWSGMRLHELIGYDRNYEALPLSQIPPGKLLSRDQLIAVAPGLKHLNPTAGALWYDGQIIDSDRLLLEAIISAEQAGATVCNYVRAEKVSLKRNGTVEAVEATDLMSGRGLLLRSNAIINASGPWASEFLGHRVKAGLERHVPSMARNINVIVPKFIDGDMAVTVPSRHSSDAVITKQNRFFFITPWKQCSIIGTMHEPYHGKVNDCIFDYKTVSGFLEEFNEAYPEKHLSLDDVIYVHGGLTPTEGVDTHGEARRSKHGVIIDHGMQDGLEGLYSIVGVKYTTARFMAEKVVSMAANKGLYTRAPAGASARSRLPGSRGFRELSQIVNPLIHKYGIDGMQAQDLAETYGVRAIHVLTSIESHGHSHISDTDLLRTKVRFAVREEMAVRLTDFVFRRSTLAEEGKLDDYILSIIAETMRQELNWSTSKTESEIEHVRESNWPSDQLGISR